MADQPKTNDSDFSIRVAEILAYQQATPKVLEDGGSSRAVPLAVAGEAVLAGVLKRGCSNGCHLVLVETVAGDLVSYCMTPRAHALVDALEAQFETISAG